MMAIVTGISVTKRYSHMTLNFTITLLSDGNPHRLGSHCNFRTAQVVKQGPHMTATWVEVKVLSKQASG